MIELFSLGDIYPSDFLNPGDKPRSEPVEMKLMMDISGFVFLEKQPEKSAMWGQYWYRSSTSLTMQSQLRNVVRSVLDVYEVEKSMVWCDAAGNDGYLLSQTPHSVIRINIDPADDTYKEEAEIHCDLVIQDYFTAESYKKSKYGNTEVSIFSCVSMFYDLDKPGNFLNDVYSILAKDGLLVMQLSYTPLMIEQLEFSNICHEHKFFYSIFNIRKLLERYGFKLMDAQLNNTNAGSFLIHAMKDVGDIQKYSSVTNRDVCNFRIASLLSYERTLRLDDPDMWKGFKTRIDKRKDEVMLFLRSEKDKGKTIYGYGASTKAATVCQYFGIDNTIITAIADKSQYKHGLVTVGTNIPIVSEEEMRLQSPDYLIIFPFHFLSEFIKREKEYLLNGGKFITILPQFQIIGND